MAAILASAAVRNPEVPSSLPTRAVLMKQQRHLLAADVHDGPELRVPVTPQVPSFAYFDVPGSAYDVSYIGCSTAGASANLLTIR